MSSSGTCTALGGEDLASAKKGMNVWNVKTWQFRFFSNFFTPRREYIQILPIKMSSRMMRRIETFNYCSTVQFFKVFCRAVIESFEKLEPSGMPSNIKNSVFFLLIQYLYYWQFGKSVGSCKSHMFYELTQNNVFLNGTCIFDFPQKKDFQEMKSICVITLRFIIISRIFFSCKFFFMDVNSTAKSPQPINDI